MMETMTCITLFLRYRPLLKYYSDCIYYALSIDKVKERSYSWNSSTLAFTAISTVYNKLHEQKQTRYFFPLISKLNRRVLTLKRIR